MRWTEEAVTRLKQMHANGASANKIAVDLNCRISRSAVLGKKSRLGLCKSARIVRCERSAARETKRLQARRQKAKIIEPQRYEKYTPIRHDPPSDHVDIHGLKTGMCCFPFDAPPGSELSTVYCGAAAVDRSWCGEHRRIVYQPARGA